MENKIEIYLVVFFLSFILFFAGIIILFVQYRNKQKAAVKEKLMTEQLHFQEMLTARLEIQKETMQEIGREIHDNVGQKLTLASLYTQQLAYENKAPQVNGTIDNISSIINQSLAELRRLSKSLTDDTIDENTIVTLLQNECKKVSELKKCRIILNCTSFSSLLSYQVKNILLRIVQEFLQNSIKHSQCKNITVTLSELNTFIQLVLQDDGIGFDSGMNNGHGIGISNMKRRTDLINGSFYLESRPGKGTLLTIEIPV